MLCVICVFPCIDSIRRNQQAFAIVYVRMTYEKRCRLRGDGKKKEEQCYSEKYTFGVSILSYCFLVKNLVLK